LQGCAAAFREDGNGGYQFMSVLTHDLGRGGSMGKVATLLLGLDSETWRGGTTTWDMVRVDWPTTQVDVSDPLKIVWDVSYGPHFSDTQDFVNTSKRNSFVCDKDRALTWDDFESELFAFSNITLTSLG
jgi:chitin-binding protein